MPMPHVTAAQKQPEIDAFACGHQDCRDENYIWNYIGFFDAL
jgi:hypothetical protein